MTQNNTPGPARDPRRAFLVLVEVTLISGQKVTAFDAFKADDAVEAANYAYNLFVQAMREDSGVVIFGETTFIADTITSFTPKTLAVLDLSDEFNDLWRRSVTIFERLLTRELNEENRGYQQSASEL